jgi:hypothetical protein
MRLMNVARVAVAVVLLFAFGCNSKNKGKIEGTKWVSVAVTVKGQSIPAGALKLEFTSDGRMTYNTPVGNFEGTYSLGMGDTVTWNFTRELGGSKKHA